VVIEQGIKEGAQIFLSTPESPENFKMSGEELISVIKDREKAKKAEELRIRQEAEKAKEQRNGLMGRPVNITPEMMQQFQNMRGSGTGPGMGQGRPRDTAAMRRFMNMRRQQGGAPRDTSARRRTNTQPGQQTVRQNAPVPAQPPVKK
jgi:hypothetical protein